MYKAFLVENVIFTYQLLSATQFKGAEVVVCD